MNPEIKTKPHWMGLIAEWRWPRRVRTGRQVNRNDLIRTQKKLKRRKTTDFKDPWDNNKRYSHSHGTRRKGKKKV